MKRILNAVTRLIVVYEDVLNDEVFKEKLGAVSVKQLIRTAKERRPGSMGVAEAMVLEYNGKKKSNNNRLFINKLHSREHAIFKTLDAPDDMLNDEASDFNEAENFDDTNEDDVE